MTLELADDGFRWCKEEEAKQAEAAQHLAEVFLVLILGQDLGRRLAFLGCARWWTGLES